jgi:hypothetical protein
MSMTAAERETVITVSDADDQVLIWTAQRAVIGRLRKHREFYVLRSGVADGSPGVEFVIPADRWSPASGAKRRVHLTDEERQARSARLAEARSKA